LVTGDEGDSSAGKVPGSVLPEDDPRSESDEHREQQTAAHKDLYHQCPLVHPEFDSEEGALMKRRCIIMVHDQAKYVLEVCAGALAVPRETYLIFVALPHDLEVVQALAADYFISWQIVLCHLSCHVRHMTREC
jgi:hypothetical protein